MDPQIPEVEFAAHVGAMAANGDYVAAVGAAMHAVEQTIADIAGTDIPVLIEGESGTGKGALAMRIHQLSGRSRESFVKLNCASLTPEFFSGRSRGTNGRNASVWLAGGTLFLDEVGELNSLCQPQLLCALPDGDVAKAGRGLRVIASTARNLDRERREGRFREDLYYRISGVCLRLPPLRQRKEDIPALMDFFLTKYAPPSGREKPAVSAAAMKLLVQHSWPGNIRELEYTVQKLLAFGDEKAALADLHNVAKDVAGDVGGGESLSLKQAARAASRQAERELILKVLSQTRWNRKRAAQELRISYKALLYKMKQIGLDSAGL